MQFQFASIIPVYILVALLMLLLSIRAWSLRPAPGASAWSMTMLFCAIFAIGSCLEMAFVEPILKLTMDRVIYIGTTGFIFFWGIFAIQYSHMDRWLNRFTLPLLMIIPLGILCLALFAEYHQLLYREYEFVYKDGLVIGQVVAYGPLFWVWLAYSNVLLAGSWILLLRSAMRSQAIFRGQNWMVIVASAAPMSIYLIHFTGLNLLAPIDPIIFIMAFSGVIMHLSMTHYRFMDIAPIAYDLIFKNVKSGIILIDLKDRVVGMNHEAEGLLSRSEKDVLGIPAVNAFPKYNPILGEYWDRKELKTEISIMELGSYYELQITPLHNRRGTLVGRVIMFYDITERKQVEQRTLELTIERERVLLLQQLISHMSHDLRTPLTSMKVTQYLLRKELAGQHSARLDSLAHQTDRLAQMVENMLTLLRLEKDELSDQFDLDMNDLLTYVIAQKRELAVAHSVQIQFNPCEGLPHVFANKDELLLAFSNLLLNAILYTPSGGKIIISSVCENASVVIKICDNGIGISPDNIPHIFERFYRVDDARRTQNGGFGLGLTITKTIVNRHAGTIDVQSKLGEGSEFSIQLPMAKAS